MVGLGHNRGVTQHTRGHSVLAIPLTELNEWVRDRTAHYDASFLGQDGDFLNAHITLLGPWIAEPSTDDLARVASIAARAPAFDFSLVELGVFPDGIIYLNPCPDQPFTALTAHLAAAFPDYPPYGGLFASVVPHLTLDQASEAVSVDSVRASLGNLIPVSARATRIDLQWWENNNCHVMASWPLA